MLRQIDSLKCFHMEDKIENNVRSSKMIQNRNFRST
jgi:hypothetical protein